MQHSEDCGVLRKCKNKVPRVVVEHLFVYSVKTTRELTHPCGAPVLIDLDFEKQLLTLTPWLWLVKKEKSHLIKKGLTLICFSFKNKQMRLHCITSWATINKHNLCVSFGVFCLTVRWEMLLITSSVPLPCQSLLTSALSTFAVEFLSFFFHTCCYSPLHFSYIRLIVSVHCNVLFPSCCFDQVVYTKLYVVCYGFSFLINFQFMKYVRVCAEERSFWVFPCCLSPIQSLPW